MSTAAAACRVSRKCRVEAAAGGCRRSLHTVRGSISRIIYKSTSDAFVVASVKVDTSVSYEAVVADIVDKSGNMTVAGASWRHCARSARAQPRRGVEQAAAHSRCMAAAS